jgi:hypothetical protein
VDSFRSALQAYEGTKNYHNFTSGKDSSEANSKRYILSFTCSDPFISHSTGVEYVLLSVLGQSFLLNQIRKMVHFAIEICRGGATLENLAVAFGDDKVEIPMAPALGLYLDELFFEGYNIKQKYQTENDKRVVQKRLEAATAIENEGVDREQEENDVDEEESAMKKQKIFHEDTAEVDADEEAGLREEIAWYALPDIKTRIDQFRTDVLHSHIMKEEEDSLIYMFYLDYCRAFPHHYKPFKKAANE